MMSFIALPMPTVLASFPNMALSFIRVAIFFLQANVTMSQDEAEDSSANLERLLSTMLGTSLTLC